MFDRIPLILDGGLATELEAAGFGIAHPLWSARVLLEAPAAIAAVHRRFLEAGAGCITTATYQASFPGFRRHGLTDRDAAYALRHAVHLAIAERDRFGGPDRALVAASVGPYGAYLADGSEYHGDYRVDDATLARFHQRRLRLLAEAGADLLAIETIPSRQEARVLAGLLARLPEAPPAWISFACRDGAHLADGTPAEAAAADLADAPGVAAVGVNCTAAAHLATLIPALRRASGKPVVAYPNGAGRWDPVRKVWETPAETASLPRLARQWQRLGAVAIGGCCRVGPQTIRAISEALTPDRRPDGR